MPHICCTQKLAGEFRETRQFANETTPRGLVGWHGNLLHLFRRKCVLLVNDATRYALFLPGLVKRDFQNFERVFLEHFALSLALLGANEGQIAQGKLLLGAFSYGKTHNRSVLASMNDVKFNLKFMLEARLGRLPETFEERMWINSYLNKTPSSGKDLNGIIFPDREMLRLLDIS